MENPLVCEILNGTESFLTKTLSIVNLNIATGNLEYIYLILLCFIANPSIFTDSFANIVVLSHFFIHPVTQENNTMEYVGLTISTLRRAFLEKKVTKDDLENLIEYFKLFGIFTDKDANQITC